MAHRTTYPIDGTKSDEQLVTAKLTGAGAANMTIPETASDIVSCTRTDTGDFSVVFRHAYPELKSDLGIAVRGSTAGLQARWVSLDVAAKTGSFTVEVGATPTDPAVGDFISINLLVRNSGRNA